MNPIPIMAFAKFQEVQNYLTITNHIITPYIWLINADFYAGLTDEERYVVDYAARVAVDAGRGISRIIEASESGLPALAAAMEVNALGAEELVAFREVAQPAVIALIEERFGDEGTTMLEAMLAALQE